MHLIGGNPYIWRKSSTMHQAAGRPTWGNWSTLILLALIWGTSFILIKKGLVTFSGMQVGALRIGIAFLFFIPIAARALRRIPRRYLGYVLAIGIFSSFIPSFLIPLGQENTDSSTAGILVSLTPLSTYLWGITIFQQKGSTKRSCGVILGLIGASILMIDPSSSMGFNPSALYILVSSVLYGISGNIVHRYLKEVNSTDITSVSFIMIGIPALGYLFTTDFISVMQSDKQAWISLGAVIILSIVGTAMALLLFWKLVQQTDPVFGSVTTYLIPIVAIMWGLLDGEEVVPRQLIGFVLILLSVFLVQQSGRKR